MVSTIVASFQNRKLAGAMVLGVMVCCLSRPFRSTAQTSGLIAAYGFNEGSGTTTADLSGNKLTGTINGATWTTGGRFGNALSFNGSTSYVDLGNSALLQLTGSMTLEAWVKAAANPADDGQIVAKSDTTGWQLKTSPDTGPHTFGVGISRTAGSHTQRYSTTVRTLNTWYHVAGVYDASAGLLNVYVNGTLDNGTLSGTLSAQQVNQAVNANIGRRSGGYYFNGVIDEVRIYNRALSQAEIQTDMNTPVGGTPPPPDTIPPTVSITAPTPNATVAGTVTITASAADNVSVAAVQFLLDGASLGEVLTAPFTYQWNTATATIGAHTLSAIARDYVGNSATSSDVPITVTNPTAAQVGQWSPVMNWPIVAVHAMLLPTGNVLAWTDYTINEGAQVWNPTTNTFTARPETVVSLFCSGHVLMADGRVAVVGGIQGLQDDLGPRNTTIFDPTSLSWSQAALMPTGRYYPTATKLGDGRILVQGGTTTCVSCIADIPEIYNPVSNVWTQLGTSARLAFQYYPHPFLLPDGRILVAGQDDRAIATRTLNLTTQTWSMVDSRIIDGHSSAMYMPGKIIKAGTATADNPGFASAPTTYVLDMTQPNPAWQPTASMAYPRSYLNLTILPDGQVLATGGSTTTDKANYAAAVYPAELWSPATKTWTTMVAMQRPRLYHSTALLLPDARVLVAGGGRENGRSQPDPKDQPNAEIFSPPYLFNGPRPVISAAPGTIQYGIGFAVSTPDAARITSVSLIAPGAVTHAFNENQRFVPLSFSQISGGLTVQAPIDGNLAPPGPYMLFLVDTNGVPSVASWVRLPAPNEDTLPPTPPGNLFADSSTGFVNLTWSASSDNVGVTGYSVYRSGTSGFTPAPGNKIGQTSTTSYQDSSSPGAGTYYYRVTAQDANGNVSTPSNEALATVAPDGTPPIVSLTAPAGGATVSGSINVTSTATDNIGMGGVQFLLDGANLGVEVAGPGPIYTVNWNTTTATNGSHTLAARARDTANNTATSPPVTVTLSNDKTPPSVSVTAPAAGSTVSGSLNITASATDDLAMGGVQFLLDGANLGLEVTGAGPNYSYAWNTTTAANGSHTISARARDSAGNTALSPNVSVTVTNTAPGGVAAAYAFDLGSGTSAADSSGNGITGTITGATWTTGKYGNALSFNGSTNYVNLGNPTALRGTGSMTWTAWVKATSTPADDGQIIAKADNSSGWQLKTSPDTGPHTFAIKVSSSGSSAQRYSTTVRQLNVWYYAAAVYNQAAKTLDIYVNGVLDNGVLRGTIPATQVVPNSDVNIGRRSGGLYFGGVIDEVRVFNRALSQAEIQTLMNMPISPLNAINIQDFKFVPNPDTVARGGLVSWTNLDGATHRIVSDTGLFDTQNITTGQSANVALPAAGTYNYHCAIHTSMVGSIVVQ